MICNFCGTDAVSKATEGGHEFYRCTNCGREGGTNLIGLPDTEHPIDQVRAWRREQARQAAVAEPVVVAGSAAAETRRVVRCSECGVPFGLSYAEDREVLVPLCRCGS